MVEPKPPPAEAGTDTQSLGRALLLLTELGTYGDRGARFTDLIGETKLAKATFRRLLAAMIRKGFVEPDARTRLCHLGAETFIPTNPAAAA
jgi:DNA-binding IclR family transcriptional regulator